MSIVHDRTNVNVKPLETWQHVWRKGIVPSLSPRHLLTLRDALNADDAALLQGASTVPPPLEITGGWDVEKACPICYMGWKVEDRRTVDDAVRFLSFICCEADRRLGEPGAVRYFINWVDDTPRAEMRLRLLAEVNRSLAQTGVVAC